MKEKSTGYHGNKNAAKPDNQKKTAVIYLRVTPGEKARAVKRAHPEKLAAHIIDLTQVKALLSP